MAQSGYTPLLVYGSSTAAAEPTAPNLTSSANGAELALNYADGKLFYKNSGGNVRLLAIGYGASTVTPTAGGIQYGTGTAVAFTAAGTAGYILQSNGASAPSWVAAPSTSPGGSNTQIQYNNSGAFGGSANVTWNGTDFNLGSTITTGTNLSFGGIATLTRITGGIANLSLVTIPPNSSNEPTTTNITTGSSANTLKIMAGVNVRGGQIDFVAGSAASAAGTLIFRTGLGGGQSEQTERMRIDSSGNVGIGTSSPTVKLHVYGSNPGFRVEGDGGSYYPEIRLDGANGSMFLTTYYGAMITGTNATGNNTIRFRTGGTTSAGAYGGSDRMIIDSSGNVLIGTTSSGSGKLNVYADNATTQPSAALSVYRSYGVFPGITSNFYGILCEAYTSGSASPTTSAGIASVNAAGVGPAFLAKTGSGGPSGYAYYAYLNNGDSNGYGSANLFRGEIVQTGPNPGNSPYYGTHITFPNYTQSGNEIYAHYWNTQYTGSGTQYFAYIVRNGSNIGSITTTASATAYNTSSDYRLKENVQPMTNALATVAQLNPVTYTWKSTGEAGQGFIAHELQAVVPDAVTGEKDAIKTERVEVSPAVPATYDEEGNELTPAVEAVFEDREVPVYQGVDTSFLVATLTAAIQELKAIVDAQAARIAVLEGK